MKPRKTDKANLEKKRGIYRDIGFVLAMLLVYTLMSARFYENSGSGLVFDGEEAILDSIPPTLRETPPPPPPPPQNQEVLQVVDDDIEVPDVEFDNMEVNEDTEIELIDEVDEFSDEIFQFTRVEAYPVFPGCEGESTNEARYECTQLKIQQSIKDEFVFPALAAELGTGGRAWVQFIIERDGSVTGISIARSSGDQSIDDEAVRAVRAALPNFTPAKVGGRAVRMSYNVPINARIR